MFSKGIKRIVTLVLALVSIVILTSSCSENYSNGERIGLVTQFSKTGVVWKSWEGHLNLTQTGMNSSSNTPFDFSVDNDHEDQAIISKLDSAANFGWKIKIVYHETFGFNWLSNRGETSHFVSEVDVLDRNPVGSIFNGKSNTNSSDLMTKAILISKSSSGKSDTTYIIFTK